MIDDKLGCPVCGSNDIGDSLREISPNTDGEMLYANVVECHNCHAFWQISDNNEIIHLNDDQAMLPSADTMEGWERNED